MIAHDAPLTLRIDALKAGDDEAADFLWKCCHDWLMAFARKRNAFDSEDAAVRAFESFCLRARDGKWKQLQGTEDFWQILGMLLVRKVCDQYSFPARRQAAHLTGDSEPEFAGLTPDAELIAEETYSQLLNVLTDEMRQIVELTLEGRSNRQVADLMCCGLRNVERKRAEIRHRWTEFIRREHS